MENKNIEIKGKGIKVHLLSSIFVAIGVIVMITSFFMIKRIYNKYDEMMDSYQDITKEREAAVSFKNASDYLTDQARRFAVTGDIAYAENYFEEKNELMHREAALQVIADSRMLKMENDLLNNAMEQSEALVVYELHAMQLVAKAYNLGEDKMPEEVSAFKLSEEELALDQESQIKQAISLLYGKEYEDYKERINWDIKNATTLIEDDLGARYRENEDGLILALNFATMLIFSMFILLVLIFIFNSLLVVRPADRFIEALNDDKKLPEIGGYEFRKFAKMYNEVYRSDKKNRGLLEEQGEVDILTGTLKVSTLDMIKHKLTNNEEPLAVMMVDVDNFRSIKESYGYETADQLVVKVAKLFKSHFKSSDYIVRTSQDEFELFLLRMKQDDANVLQDRIAEINKELQDSADQVPAASVSVGIAFSENGYTVDAERAADMALNNVKKNGRAGCKIAES